MRLRELSGTGRSPRPSPRSPLRRLLPVGALGIFALLAGLWAGLIRAGWRLPPVLSGLPVAHGALMVSGFLGTLIGLERAVALGRRWAFLAPASAALASVTLVAGARTIAQLLFAAGGVVLVLIFVAIYQRQPAVHVVAMGASALVWTAGNLAWLATGSLPRTMPWWTAFLILMIAGERLELSRLLHPSRAARIVFLVAGAGLVVGAAVAGAVVSPPWYVAGGRIVAAGMIVLAGWLLRYDVVRPLVRQHGAHRFTAINLLAGYAWLLAGGILWLAVPEARTGFLYDARLHAVFAGFVFSMIFAHAPIILPAITGRGAPFRPAYYAHVGLLHLGLILRVAADLAGWLPGRRWGALLNVLALLLFLANTVRARAGTPRI